VNVLHLSDTPLSGGPLRIHNLLNKYSKDVESKYIMWQERAGHRYYGSADAGSGSSRELLEYLIYEWSNVLHLHNRWRRQSVFKILDRPPPKKPSVIHIHNPRDSENFRDEIDSGIPIAVPAQYHPRVYPECKFIMPNVVDIYDPVYMKGPMPEEGLPVVSYSPSNTNARLGSWDDKSYSVVGPILKRMRNSHEIDYQLIHKKPFAEVMAMKREAWIGVDEISTGSFHLSGLEYLSLGVPCFSGIDSLTEGVVKDLTGCSWLPWVKSSKDNFERVLRGLLTHKEIIIDQGTKSRQWMEAYWAPETLAKIYLNMYEKL